MPVAEVQQGPFSYDEYTNISSSQASTRAFNLSNSSFDTSIGEVLEVFVSGVKLKGEGKNVAGDEFTVNNTATIATIASDTDLANATDSTVTQLAAGNDVLFRRVSNRTSQQVDFQPGSVIREADLDNANKQVFRIAQESIDIARDAMPRQADGNFNANNNKVLNLGYPDASSDAASKAYVDAVASGQGQNLVSDSGTFTLTNKTIDVDNNTVSNIEVDNLKSGVLDTDLSSVSASDDTLASAKAIKTYVDTQVDTKDQLSELDDITITSLADNHVLSYDSSDSRWKNQAPVDAGLATTEAANSSAIVMAIALG
tara:strand:- start:650 stop:1591 length:942 start_codon:yes stop_codon:yes gene_type:complete